MNLFANIENIYFTGIGGIGMSALARYFLAGDYNVGGYDKTESSLTKSLDKEGCQITYQDRVTEIPDEFKNNQNTIVIFTPAIPDGNQILNYFRSSGFNVFKRSTVLGMISEKSRTIAIAGTHGKTTISTITAHLLKQSTLDCTAFLGGISKNYNSNLILGEGKFAVMEADEYDRSFHSLSPEIALITSMDPDHLEVYGNHENMIKAYRKFGSGIVAGGKLVVHRKIRSQIRNISGIKIFTYGEEADCDFRLTDYKIIDESYHFTFETPNAKIENLIWTVPGRLNLHNALAAVSLSLLAGVTPEEVRRSLFLYKGVERRFDIRVNHPGFLFIDDYAHHPEELNFLIDSVREFYGDKRITALFQPHLFTRTRDHAESFARSLEKLNKVFLLPIYPAREEPIEGVTSELILSRMNAGNPEMVTKEQFLKRASELDTEIFITIGAGDIDRMVAPLVDLFNNRTG